MCYFVAKDVNILVYSVEVAFEEKFLCHVDFEFNIEIVEGLGFNVKNSEEVGTGVFLEILNCKGKYGISFNSFTFIGDVFAFDGKTEGYFKFS